MTTFRGSEHIDLTSDLVRDFVLPVAAHVTGQILGYAGAPAAFSQVRLNEDATGALLASTRADELGRYAIDVAPGRYRITLPFGFPPPAGTPNFGWVFQTGPRDIVSDTTFDIQLPVSRVSGIVSDSSGAPVAGVVVQAVIQTSTASSNGRGTTDAQGRYDLLTLDGSALFTLRPPPGFAGMTATIPVTGDALEDFELPDPARLTGRVRGHSGAPVPGVLVQVSEVTSGNTIATQTTDATGSYGVDVAPGSYRLVLLPAQPPPPAGTPNQEWSFQSTVFGVAAATNVDIDLPLALIDGIAIDENGVPVPRVTLFASVAGSEPDGLFFRGSSRAVTASDGIYQLSAFLTSATFSGSATFTATPPAGSGFSTTALGDLEIAGDFSQTIALQHPDLLAPVIVAGPLVVHLGDTSVSLRWDTDEPADSVVEFGVGEFTTRLEDDALVTRHEVTLLDLEPSTNYEYRVISSDASGNGPTASPVDGFTTLAPPGDETPPLIAEGPEVISTGLDDALVHWVTDEPATSVVHFGLTEELGETLTLAAKPAGEPLVASRRVAAAALQDTVSVEARFTTDHLVRLSGLEPGTLYFYLVESSDPDGNGPTPSAIGTFTTASTADTTAPRVLEGPSIVARTTTSLTVRWVTDEPSDSGVSANDGTVFFVTGDDRLTSTHQVVLTGLTAATEYEITVSSRDRIGNGPTLGGPILESTLGALDTDPPLLDRVVVSAITADSALVTWSTNEPATSQLRFGLSTDDLSGVVGEGALVLEHSLRLTGLSAATRYFVVVASLDAAGLSSESPSVSFFTLDDPPVDEDLDADGVPDAIDLCPDTPPDDHVDADGCSRRCPPSVHHRHHRRHPHHGHRGGRAHANHDDDEHGRKESGWHGHGSRGNDARGQRAGSSRHRGSDD